MLWRSNFKVKLKKKYYKLFKICQNTLYKLKCVSVRSYVENIKLLCIFFGQSSYKPVTIDRIIIVSYNQSGLALFFLLRPLQLGTVLLKDLRKT